MNRRIFLVIVSLCPVMLGLVCPTDLPVLPPTLGAPVIDTLAVGAYLWDGQLREGIRLVWHPPSEDSISVSSYSIFRMIKGDSAFSRIQHQRPASLTSYVDRADRIGYPLVAFKLVFYRIVAVDSLGRLSDTSVVSTIGLAARPDLDSARYPDFSWSVTGNGYGYYTYISLWDTMGTLLWQSPRPLFPTYAQENDISKFAARLPDTLHISPQRVSWGAHVDHVTGTGYAIGSLRIEQFEIPY